jgi:hypothetical protein
MRAAWWYETQGYFHEAVTHAECLAALALVEQVDAHTPTTGYLYYYLLPPSIMPSGDVNSPCSPLYLSSQKTHDLDVVSTTRDA